MTTNASTLDLFGLFEDTTFQLDHNWTLTGSSQYYEMGVDDQLYGYELGEWWTPHGGVPMQGIWRATRVYYPTSIYCGSTQFYHYIVDSGAYKYLLGRHGTGDAVMYKNQPGVFSLTLSYTPQASSFLHYLS